jgi:hypothetical protein
MSDNRTTVMVRMSYEFADTPMRYRMLKAAVSFVLLLACTQVVKGDGFPPFGAWAYGTGAHYVGHVRHPYVGHHFRRSVHYGGYRSVGFTTSVGFGWPYYLSYRACFPAYRSVYVPVVSYPSYYVPACVTPSVYYAPTYPVVTYPFITQNVSSAPNTTLLADRLRAATKSATKSTSAGQPQTVQLVDIDYARPTPSAKAIPDDLLAAADALMQAGGYRQAGAAYAALNIRYGSSDLIFGRRFIAQVASGDLEQAAVVLASARAAGFSLNPQELPGGDLKQLFGHKPQQIVALTERLASQALTRLPAAEPMEMIGVWQKLAGEPERANMFLAMARELSSQTQPSESPMDLSSPSALVSLE